MNAQNLQEFWILALQILTQHGWSILQISALVMFGLFVARTVVTFLARKTGLYNPTHYRLWPRVPWRIPHKAFLKIQKWYEQFKIGKQATGGFSGVLTMLTLLFRPGQLLIGRAYGAGIGWLQPIGLKVARHIMIYAMTGSSKTTGIITMLACWFGSAIVIDPKAQIINALARHDWRKWFVLDLYGISDFESVCFNPIDIIKEAMKRDGKKAAALWAMRIAEALIITPEGSRSPYFTDVSRQYLTALILHVITMHPEEEHNLPYIRKLIVEGYEVIDDNGEVLTSDREAHELLARMMMKNTSFDLIAGGASAMASASGDTGGNVRSTLQEQTKWLDIPEVQAVMRTSTFSLSELKTRDDIVFAFTAPIFSIRQELSPLSRLLTNLTAYIFEAIPNKNKKGLCLFILDELPSQGYNSTIEVMLAVMRSFGLIVVAISQSIELMKKSFPKSWQSFSGEADATLWSGGNHQSNVEHLTQILGKKTLVEKNKSSGYKSYREMPVADPDQLRRFLDPDSGNLIVTRASGRPLKLKSEPYFKALPVWKYAPDPDHKEALLRRLSRFLFDRKNKAQIATTSKPVKQEQTADDASLPALSIQVLNLLKEHQRLTIAQIVELTSANQNTLKVRLRELVNDGRILRHGKARATWYSLN